MKSKTKAPGIMPARVYIPLAEIVTACALSPVGFDNRFRPAHWGVPADFIYSGRNYEIQYAESVLHELADSLHAAGEGDAALRLREWIKELPLRERAPDGPPDAGKLVDVQRVAAGPDEIDAAVAKLGRRHASDRETVPHNFMRDWEQTHDA